MRIYTFSEARQRLAALLDEARREGQVRIWRRDGQEFVVEPAPSGSGSPLDVPGLGLDLTMGDVVALVRESRRSTERFLGPAASTRSRRGTRPSGRKRGARG